MIRLIFIIAIACTSVAVHAETIKLKLGEQGKETLDEMQLPARGADMEQVRAQYGEPNQVKGPTGNPPITTWHYEHFSVYFEGQHVLHSVRKHKR